MKGKKSFLTLLMACFVVVLFCLAGTAIGGPGPNPSIPTGYKQMGPSLKGVLIAGWKFDYDVCLDDSPPTPPDECENYPAYGTVESFLVVEGNFYAAVMMYTNPEEVFLDADPLTITTWLMPKELASTYNIDENALVVILEEKDVSNFELIQDITYPVGIGNGGKLTYDHMLHCNVRITFLVPTDK